MSRRLAQMLRPQSLVFNVAICRSRQSSCQRSVKRAVTTFAFSSPPTNQAHNHQLATSSASLLSSTNLRHDVVRLSSTTAPEPPKRPRKVTTLSIASKKRRGHKITMVTAYDYPSAVHVDRAGIDVVLVGDSCAMVELGFETTQVRDNRTFRRLLHCCALINDMSANHTRSNDTSLSGSKAWCTQSSIACR